MLNDDGCGTGCQHEDTGEYSSFNILRGAVSMATGSLGYMALGRLSYSVTWSLGYNGSTPEERGVSMGRQRGPSSPANGACASAGRSSQAESDPEPAVMRPTGRGVNKIGCTSVSTVRVPTRGSPANHRRRTAVFGSKEEHLLLAHDCVTQIS